MESKIAFESLEMNIHHEHFRRKERGLLKEMLLHSNSLTTIDIIWYDDNLLEHRIPANMNNNEQVTIKTLLDINRDFKRYISIPVVVVTADADEIENAKRIKIRTLVNIFIKSKIKPIMRDTITFILLNEYGLVIIQDENYKKDGNKNGIILRSIYSSK
mmetsp:Transcript_47140/g.47994  ORF Transcript_47140/g.47994 Transcript_47140/m.47994 type:complete len:159 (-) Transcript_47140:440-916(-)